MDSTKMCRFLAYGCLFLLTLVGDPTDSCACAKGHPQENYCEDDFVIKGKFMSWSEVTPMYLSRYTVQVSKVFKSPQKMKGTVSLNNQDTYCSYAHQQPYGDEEYVITGWRSKDGYFVSRCSFIRPWAQLSPEQKKGFTNQYKEGCSCKILNCDFTTGPCVATDSLCTWRMDSRYNEKMACVPKFKNRGPCSWKPPR